MKENKNNEKEARENLEKVKINGVPFTQQV